jgi:hypothetical protein
MNNKRYLMAQLKGFQVSEIELIGKEWELWLERQSRETIRAYLQKVIAWVTELGFSLEEAKQITTSIALKNGMLFTYALLAGWKAYELRAMREAA